MYEYIPIPGRKVYSWWTFSSSFEQPIDNAEFLPATAAR